MKPAWAFGIAGVVLTLLGFAAIIGGMDGLLPFNGTYVGVALILLGPLTIIAGFVVYAFRKPTEGELARQQLGEMRSWHFRRRGLLILFGTMGVFVSFALWLEQFYPGINSGRRPFPAFVFGVVCVILLSFRKVRDQVFHTGRIPEPPADAGDRASLSD